MKRPHYPFLITIMFLILYMPSHAQDKLLKILSDEMNREMTELKKQDTPPYFISYSVTETEYYSTGSAFGALTGSNKAHTMNVTVSVRVGDYDLDNSHELRGDQYSQYLSQYSRSAVPVPLDLNEDAIRSALWKETNQVYKQAVELYSKVKANVAVKIKEEEQAADFSKELKPEIYFEAPLSFDSLLGDRPSWENKVKSFSQPFLKEKNIYSANSSFSFTLVRKYFLSSEGSSIVHNLSYTHLYVNSVIKSSDGMEQPLFKGYFAYTPSGLPDEKLVLNDVETMLQKLIALRDAPEVEPFTGPALLSGRASSVFFHEIFGHRIEGHRLKKTDDAQTFRKKLNEKILPEHLSVIFDPGKTEWNKEQLNGYYKYDDEGVKAQKVNIVENGILKNFLMSRSPLDKFKQSNGHGRAQMGQQPVTRQSNLIVESNALLPMSELRQKLIGECKKQGKQFGLLFDDVIGGFTMTGRFMPNAFNVTPTVVYKVYVDGRPDELVRGVDLVGTPLMVFSNIASVGDEYGVFNGTCGAESGGVPVSGVSPALLVTQIEVQKKIKSQERPPILARPDLKKNP